MTCYATVDEYVARYGDVDDVEHLEAVMEDASTLIACELRDSGVDPDSVEPDALSMVCRSVAFRAMGGDAPTGASQYSQSANGFSESFTLSNPSGDLYLTKQERTMLGVGKQRAAFIAPAIDGGCDA